MKNKYFIYYVLCFLLFLIQTCERKENYFGKNINYSIDITNKSFEELHSIAKDIKDKYLFFGNVKIENPGIFLKKELRSFYGRWEGVRIGTPVKNDILTVLSIYKITNNYAKLFITVGSDLHYPFFVEELTVTPIKKQGKYFLSYIGPVQTNDGTINGEILFWLSEDHNSLKYSVISSSLKLAAMYECKKDENINIFKNLEDDLNKKNITAHDFFSEEIAKTCKQYLLYRPENSIKNEKPPLLIFFHGTGDIGLDALALWKASPFRYIVDEGDLPFLIFAPVLNDGLSSFPRDIFPKLLKEILSKYKINKNRIYVTGLSMGGFAAWEFAFRMPDKIAAIAPLSCADSEFFYHGRSRFKPFSNDDYKRIRGLPVYSVNGKLDFIVTVESAKRTAEKAIKYGVDLKFEVLEDLDHDTWSKTYSNTEFYNWLLQHSLTKKE